MSGRFVTLEGGEAPAEDAADVSVGYRGDHAFGVAAHGLDGLDEHERLDTLCELNVKEQVTNVCNTPIVQKAWKAGQTLSVHGWIYNINNGLLKSLVTVDSSGIA